jgi:hypothetical protein
MFYIQRNLHMLHILTHRKVKMDTKVLVAFVFLGLLVANLNCECQQNCDIGTCLFLLFDVHCKW